MIYNPVTLAGRSAWRCRNPLAFALALGISATAASAQGDIRSEMLKVHNDERAAVGVQPLAWDQDLADEAREYGEKLAQTTGLTHDNAPENLWRGGADATYTAIAQAWAGEKANYRNAEFKVDAAGSQALSKTGRWSDIGHYSQIVWRGTTRVGCATVRSAVGKDMVGICRYAPAGNVQGQWAYGASSLPPTDMTSLQSRVLTHWNQARWESGRVGPLVWDHRLAADAEASLAPRLSDTKLGEYRPPFGELFGAAAHAGATPPPPPSP